MPDFLVTPIYLPEFDLYAICGGLNNRTDAHSRGSEAAWVTLEPPFDWAFGLETPALWNRVMQFGICCHEEISIDVHYKAGESDSFDGVFTIKIEDADGERTVFDAALEVLPSEGGVFDKHIVELIQPQPCGVLVTIEGEITSTANAGGEPNEGTFWIQSVIVI